MDLSNLQSKLLPPSSSYVSPYRIQTRPVKPFFYILISTLLTLPFLYYLLTLTLSIHPITNPFPTNPATRYGIVIDAGPSASWIRVFDGKGSVSMKGKKRLREFESEPEMAGESVLAGLLEFAKGRVPEAEWPETGARLVENGGLVRVRAEARRRILESCRRVLRASGFRFKDEWVSSITDQDKAIYAWIAANYVLGTLGANPQDTTGLVELGGTSVQIVFVPKEPPPMEFSRMVKLSGITYNLYSISIHHLGQDPAWELLVDLHGSETSTKPSSFIGDTVMSPCIPRGYNQTSDLIASSNASVKKTLAIGAAGNFSACRAMAIVSLQRQDSCSHPPCRIIDKILPELPGMPLSPRKFFYTSELFGLIPGASLLEVEAAGHHYCEDGWNKLKDEHIGVDESDLLKYCFSTAYIVALLHDGLGIPLNEKRIGFTDPVETSAIDWTLGAFILQTMDPTSATENTLNIVGSDAVTYISLFTILFLAILALIVASKWRKPRFKTVYDLEKGHYIVTRLPR